VVTLRQRLDQGALHRSRRGGMLLRPRHGLPRLLRTRRRNGRIIDMRAAGERDAPMRHGAGRIEPRRLLEGADGLAMVEAEEKAEALVEIALRPGRAGRDRARVIAEVV